MGKSGFCENKCESCWKVLTYQFCDTVESLSMITCMLRNTLPNQSSETLASSHKLLFAQLSPLWLPLDLIICSGVTKDVCMNT